MKILVDADACPVVKQVEKIAQKHRVLSFCFAIQTTFFHQITVKLK